VKQKRTAEIAIQRCKPTFNHAFALSRLRDDDMKMAVCSNSIRKTIELMMELSDLSQHLDLIVSNEDVSKAKPDPEMYLKAMSELGVQPHETLILEDNEHGIQAARASGAQVLVIGTPDDVEYARIKQAMAEAVS
jgi:HAD superfamily hydrolase (TIGR01549 family)